MQYQKCFNIAFSKAIQFYLKLFKVNKNLAQLSFYFLLNSELLDKQISKLNKIVKITFSNFMFIQKANVFCMSSHYFAFSTRKPESILFLGSFLSRTLLKNKVCTCTVAASGQLFIIWSFTFFSPMTPIIFTFL